MKWRSFSLKDLILFEFSYTDISEISYRFIHHVVPTQSVEYLIRLPGCKKRERVILETN